MKQLREIIFESLVKNLGVAPTLLSRVEGNEPVVIELTEGGKIYVAFHEKTLHTYVEIPFRDRRSLTLNVAKLIEVLCSDESLLMNIEKDKVIVYAGLGEDITHLERKLSDKLNTFNKLAHQLKNS